MYQTLAYVVQHWSSRQGNRDKTKSLWCGWAVLGSAQKFWFAGDTGYCDTFKEIGQQYGPFDLSAIPIGAYKPRWFMGTQHVEPVEAIQIHQVTAMHQQELSFQHLTFSTCPVHVFQHNLANCIAVASALPSTL